MDTFSGSFSPHRPFVPRLLIRKVLSLFSFVRVAWLFLIFILPSSILADSRYYEHVIFDNSLTRDSYFYSYGHTASPSTLELENEKLPVDSRISLSPPTALRLAWTSVPNGGWTAQIDVVRFRGRPIHFEGANLYVWCYAPDDLAAAALPRVSLLDTRGQFSTKLDLSSFSGNLPAKKWVQFKIPLAAFHTASIYSFEPTTLHENRLRYLGDDRRLNPFAPARSTSQRLRAPHRFDLAERVGFRLAVLPN